ncbi:AAA family ATPase [uncultured Thiodictyon sp.]|uniref:tyrosine-protein kinase family protein n=1 Tax=uncultured Thiodictyon sp. TaxID=1846217 RepID=UPI0025CC431B|nr:AAA family ATPase [uncultured Thiodictyon sp.]
MKSVRFNSALRRAAELAEQLPPGSDARLIRDVYGRLRFAVNTDRSACPAAIMRCLENGSPELGAFAAPGGVLFRDDFADPDALFAHEDWHRTVVPGPESDDGTAAPEIVIDLLDRQITGQDWLHTPSEAETEGKRPPRIVFYGVKGGVGRSTALAMLAYRLARDGKRVLLIDFDLESPGLSGLLLPPQRMAAFGLVDWFVEDAVGQAEGVLQDIISDSPLADHTTGSIRVVATMGQGETAYLAKLARVYADVPRHQGPERFASRMRRVVTELEALEQPDVVLIDSRAGLHDLAAIAIAGLSTVALLFATDAAQNWQGYKQLFSHWQRRPEVLRHVRKRLAIVQALFPDTDQQARASSFQQHAYDLFADTMYDQIEPGADTPLDAFNFDLGDEDAPHFPLRVRWSQRLQEFDPLLPVEKGGVSDADIESAFGPFFDAVTSLVENVSG